MIVKVQKNSTKDDSIETIDYCCHNMARWHTKGGMSFELPCKKTAPVGRFIIQALNPECVYYCPYCGSELTMEWWSQEIVL